MTVAIPFFDPLKRKIILEKAGHNVQILPGELVELDLSTDSLQHHAFKRPAASKKSAEPAFLEFQKLVKTLFGFPYSIPLAQGRMAEAMLSRLLVRNGLAVPCNMAFPTTRLHQELSGGRSIECAGEKAYDPKNGDPFKGDIDVEKLEKTIEHYSPRWVSHISIETSVNGIGGQPFSMENLKAARAVADKHHLRIFLDACRILEQAYQIQKNEPGYGKKDAWDIVREICSMADGLTMSFTKDFATPIGGMAAFRDETLYQEAFDFVMAMGDGLSHEAKTGIVDALEEAKKSTAYIAERMELVKILHEGLESLGIDVFKPVGGHAVLINLKTLLPNLSEDDFPAEALNHELYSRFGLRGSPHMGSPRQAENGDRFFRLAVPIFMFDRPKIGQALKHFSDAHSFERNINGLRQTVVPAGLSGAFRASFSPMERVKK